MTSKKVPHTPLISNIGCIIMASGEGKRFGTNKLMADFCGKPLISHIINTAQNVFCSIVVVTRHKDVELMCKETGVDVIYHDLPYRSDTVKLGLSHFGKNFDGYIFCQGDQPLLKEDTLYNMAEEFKENKEKIVRLQYQDTPCSPVIFPQWAYDSLANLPQGKGGNVVVKNNADKVVYVNTPNIYETIDVDTKEDLQKLMGYINT